MERRTDHGRQGLLLVGSAWLLLLACGPHLVMAGASRYRQGIGIRFTDRTIAPIVDHAVGLWTACSAYGHEFPPFREAGSGFRTVEIEVLASSLDDRCGDFVGERIRLYRHAQLSPGRWRSCGSLAHNLAHELGHVLGLSESAVGNSSIMISVNPWTNHSRRVTEQDCERASKNWDTRLELGVLPRDQEPASTLTEQSSMP